MCSLTGAGLTACLALKGYVRFLGGAMRLGRLGGGGRAGGAGGVGEEGGVEREDVGAEDRHVEGFGEGGDAEADAAHSDDAEGFSVELGAEELVLPPFPVLQGGVGVGDAAGEGDQESEDELGDGVGQGVGGGGGWGG